MIVSPTTGTSPLRRAGGRFFVLAGAVGLVLSACSSAPPDVPEAVSPFQALRVDTPGITGASCVVQTVSGSLVLTSPASVDVPRSAVPLAVSCSKGEHYRGQSIITARFMADGTYAYPVVVSVPMTLYTPSLKPKYKVIPHG